MATFEQVLSLAQQLPLNDQARLRAALSHAEATARAEQVARNHEAIAMLDDWAAADDIDDGDETWDQMLRAIDQHRESTRLLYASPAERHS